MYMISRDRDHSEGRGGLKMTPPTPFRTFPKTHPIWNSHPSLTSLGHIKRSYTNLNQTSKPLPNIRVSTELKVQNLGQT